MTGGQPHTTPLCSRRIRRSFHVRRPTSFSSPCCCCCCCFFRKFSFFSCPSFFSIHQMSSFYPRPLFFFFFHFFFFNFVGCQFAWQRRQRLVPETVALWRRAMTGWSATTGEKTTFSLHIVDDGPTDRLQDSLLFHFNVQNRETIVRRFYGRWLWSACCISLRIDEGGQDRQGVAPVFARKTSSA